MNSNLANYYKKREYYLQKRKEYRKKHRDRLILEHRQYRKDHPEYVKDHNSRFLNYKGKLIHYPHQIRTHICSKCGKQGQTNLHHTKYDDENPLANTIELCVMCHNKNHGRCVT